MALEFGSGTQADPYLLVNLADVQALFVSYQASGKYFALVANLDCSATTITHNVFANAVFHLDGRGFELVVKLAHQTYGDYVFYGWGDGSVKNCKLKILNAKEYAVSVNGVSAFTLSNTVLQFSNNGVNSAGYKIVKGSDAIIVGGNCGVLSGTNIFKDGSVVTNTINTASFADGNKFNKANYPTLAEEKWIFDGVSLPRPRPQATADLTTRYGVKGQSLVGSNGQQRNVAVFTENGLRYKLQTTKSDGTFFINLNDVATPVILLVHDEIGAKLVAYTAYALNQLIHPAAPNGYRYRCTLAGNSGATLPAEPWPTAAVLTVGSAQFTPEPVFEPKAHGPLLPVLFNLLTELPV